MSTELASEGARKLRPATVNGNQRHAATLLAEQIDRDRQRFPIPGLSREAHTNLRNETRAIGEVAGASVPKKGSRVIQTAALTERPQVDAKLTAVPTQTVAAERPTVPTTTRTTKFDGPSN